MDIYIIEEKITQKNEEDLSVVPYQTTEIIRVEMRVQGKLNEKRILYEALENIPLPIPWVGSNINIVRSVDRYFER